MSKSFTLNYHTAKRKLISDFLLWRNTVTTKNRFDINNPFLNMLDKNVDLYKVYKSREKASDDWRMARQWTLMKSMIVLQKNWRCYIRTYSGIISIFMNMDMLCIGLVCMKKAM